MEEIIVNVQCVLEYPINVEVQCPKEISLICPVSTSIDLSVAVSPTIEFDSLIGLETDEN